MDAARAGAALEGLKWWPVPCLPRGGKNGLRTGGDMTRKIGITLSVAGLALIGACSRGNDARPDDALKNDLALAAQAQPYTAQQFVSPSEMQYGPNGAMQYNAAARAPSYGPAPVYQPVPVYRAPARRTTSRSSSRGSS